MTTSYGIPWTKKTFLARDGSLAGWGEGELFHNVSITSFKSSVNTGEFVPGVYRVNPYEVADGRIISVPAGTVEVTAARSIYQYKGTLQGNFLAYPLHAGLNLKAPSTESIAQQALQKAYAKLGDSSLSLGEDLGELRETIEMLRNPLGSLKKFLLDDRQRNLRLLKALARKDRRQVNRLLGRTGLASIDAMTSTWLELRYGLRPLVYLTQDVIDMVSDKAKNIWDPTKIRSARSNISKVYKSTWDTHANLTSMYVDSTTSVVDKATVYAAVQYRQSSSNSLLDQLGLTPKYLPEVAWELTRLSFVLDWFISIGPWLGSLRVNPSIEILGNTVGNKLEREVDIQARTGQFILTSYQLLMPIQPISGEAKAEWNSYSRSVNRDVSFIPHLTYGRTWDYFKSLDSIALLWSVIH